MFKTINKVGQSNENQRVLWTQQALNKIPAGLSILDAGAGECQFQKYCTHLNYTSQDFAQYQGTGEAGLQTGTWDNSKIDIISDILSIPVEDSSFDALLCTEVLEHLPNPVAAIKEFSRIVKPNGYLIITAPFASLTHFAPYHFASGFNRYFYEKHLTENGFDITEIVFNGNYFEYLAQETRRVSSISKKYSGITINYFERKIVNQMLHLLNKLSNKDTGSSELLCHGIHVFARKMK